jgi:hypothetical protein
MALESDQLRAIRKRCIELLDGDEWFMLEEDEIEARTTLSRYQDCNTQYAIVDFVLKLLREDFRLEPVELRNPRYCPGTGYVMRRPCGYDIYIKIRLTDSISNQQLHIMSFHPEQPY